MDSPQSVKVQITPRPTKQTSSMSPLKKKHLRKTNILAAKRVPDLTNARRKMPNTATVERRDSERVVMR